MTTQTNSLVEYWRTDLNCYDYDNILIFKEDYTVLIEECGYQGSLWSQLHGTYELFEDNKVRLIFTECVPDWMKPHETETLAINMIMTLKYQIETGTFLVQEPFDRDSYYGKCIKFELLEGSMPMPWLKYDETQKRRIFDNTKTYYAEYLHNPEIPEL